MNKVISISNSFSLAIKSAFPPKVISIPQKAMLVAMVTPPRQPFCATISASRPSSQALHKGYTTKVCKSDILINKINKVYNPCTVQWHVEIAYGQQLSGFIVCNSGKEHIFYLMRDRSFCQVLRRSLRCSPLVVPTSMGCLVLCTGAISTTVEITSNSTSCPSRFHTSVTKCIPLVHLNLFTHDYLQCVHGSRQPKSNKFPTSCGVIVLQASILL
jgi:hypothetical protein